jgi:hypothetical protein
MKILQKYEFLIKWVSTVLVIIGAYLTAVDITPLNKIVLLISSTGWVITGLLWKQPSLWVLNAYLVIVYAYGLIR